MRVENVNEILTAF